MAEGFTRPASDPAADEGKARSFDSSLSRADPIGTGHEAQDNLSDAESGDTSGPTKLDALSKAEAQMTQFPSLHGQSYVEIAERSSDVTAKTSKVHRKVFVVFHGGDGFDESEFDHAPNINATRQYMLDHGLRPVGDVTFAGSEAYDDRNVNLTYQVEALPAAVAVSPETAHVVVSQD